MKEISNQVLASVVGGENVEKACQGYGVQMADKQIRRTSTSTRREREGLYGAIKNFYYRDCIDGKNNNPI